MSEKIYLPNVGTYQMLEHSYERSTISMNSKLMEIFKIIHILMHIKYVISRALIIQITKKCLQ